AHNMAASMAGGIGLLIGMYDFQVFRDAARSPGWTITVDFLQGQVLGGKPSAGVVSAAKAYRDALPRFCTKHHISPEDFQEMTARYTARPGQCSFIVTITDRLGRRSSTEYSAPQGKRLMILDNEGRLRP